MKLAEKILNILGINEDAKKLGILKANKTKLQKKLKTTGKSLGDGNFSDDIAVHIALFKNAIQMQELQASMAKDKEAQQHHAEQIAKLQNRIKKYSSFKK